MDAMTRSILAVLLLCGLAGAGPTGPEEFSEPGEKPPADTAAATREADPPPMDRKADSRDVQPVTSEPAAVVKQEPANAVPKQGGDAAPERGSADSFESLRPALLEKWNRIGAFSATVTSLVSVGPPDGRFHRRGDGRYDFLRKDGKELIRFVEHNLHTVHREEGDGASRETVETVVDGESAYVITERGGRARAVKYPVDKAPVMRLGGERYLDLLSHGYDIKVLPTEVVNGRPAHVLQAIPKRGAGKIYHYVDQETGMALKTSVDNEPAQAQTVVTITEVNFGVTFNENHFRFSPPPGVTVVDGTVRAEAKDAAPAEMGPPDPSPADPHPAKPAPADPPPAAPGPPAKPEAPSSPPDGSDD